jgi:HK97 family phage major capsid protein
MKDFLKKLIQRKKDEQTKLNKRMDESEDIKEVRSIGETLKTIAQEIAEAEAQLQAIENEPKDEPQEEPQDDEARADDNLDPNEEEPTNENVERSKDYVKVGGTDIRHMATTNLRGGNPMDKEQREAQNKEIEERAKLLKEGRAVTIASDNILLPKHQSNELATVPFRQVSTFYDLTKVRNLQGGESYEAPFTKSYGTGGLTEEGSAYTEVEPEFGTAKINKVKVTAYAEFSEELERLPNANYEAEIRKGVEIALKKKMAQQQIGGTGESNTFIGITSSNADNKAVLASDDMELSKIDQDTLNKIIFAYGGDEEVEQKGVLVLNKADLLAFSLVKNDIGDHAYKIDLANQTINTVPYIINSNLTPLDTAIKGQYSMIYGIPQYYETAIFSPVEIKKSYDYKFKDGMIAYRASVFAGGNTTAYRGFMRVKKGEPVV